MAGLGRYGRANQEEVRRRFVEPTVTQNDPAKITFFDREVYGLKQSVFDCERIFAQVTREQCSASFLRTSNIGSRCYKCPIGSQFSGGAQPAEDRHSAINASLGMACVRCERTCLTADRVIGRFRLTRKHTLCISCVNRELEIIKGENSKGATPKKWAHLLPATITIEDAAGERKTVDIGLRADYLECARYVDRLHPGATLIETAIGDETIQQFSLWTPLPFSLWNPGMVRGKNPSKPKHTYTHRVTPRTREKTSAVASTARADAQEHVEPASEPENLPAQIAAPQVLRQAAQPRRKSKIKPQQPREPGLSRQTAAYRMKTYGEIAKPVEIKRGRPLAHEESLTDFGFGVDQREFIEWLCADWPVFAAPAPIAARQTADFGLGEEEWDTPLYKIGRPAPSDESSADGNGQARRCGWLPPMTDAEDAAYRASFDEPAEPVEPVADAAALPEAVEPVSEPAVEPEEDVATVARAPITFSTKTASDWARDIVAQGRRGDDAPQGCDDMKLELFGSCSLSGEPMDTDDEHAAIVAPEVEPEASQAPLRPVQKLTGKQRKRLEKAAKRFQREQRIEQNIAKRMPSTQAKPTAIASRALAIFMGMPQ